MGKYKSSFAHHFLTDRAMQINRSLLPLLVLLLAFGCREKEKKSPAPDKEPGIDSLVPPQQNAATTFPGVDISPMDMSYFPVDYPKLKMAGTVTDPPVARVIYSRPHLQKRHLFRDLLRYEEPWRLGANESTEIEFYQPVAIQGKKITPGRYILYCIPHMDAWTIVLNANTDTWGLRQDAGKDIQRFKIPITTGHPSQEYFTMVFEKAATGADLLIAWDSVVAKLPLVF